MLYIYGNIYHQYTPNVSIYTIHGSYGYGHCYKIRHGSSHLHLGSWGQTLPGWVTWVTFTAFPTFPGGWSKKWRQTMPKPRASKLGTRHWCGNHMESIWINRISIGYSVLLCSLSLRILRNSRNPSKPFLQEGHKWVVVMVKIRSSRHNLVSIHRFVSTCPKETPRKPRTRRHIDCFSTLMTRKIANTCDTWPFVPGASTVFSNLKYTRMILHDHVCFMLAGTNNFYEWQANYLTSSVL